MGYVEQGSKKLRIVNLGKSSWLMALHGKKNLNYFMFRENICHKIVLVNSAFKNEILCSMCFETEFSLLMTTLLMLISTLW